MDMRLRPERFVGLLLVAAMHAAALWGLWQHRLLPSPRDAVTLFVNFIAPPPEPPKPEPPRPRRPSTPPPQRLVAQAPVVAAEEYVAPPPPPVPAPAITVPVAYKAPSVPAAPAGPVQLRGELAVACPERTPPRYPHHSRRLGEEGAVVLRVELAESGAVAAVRVQTSSGFERLDDAALEAVREWHCHPTVRDGQPVRAVALQPFKFVLQGN